MAELKVTCIDKDDRQDPTERIKNLGGPGWYKTQQEVIKDIENKTHRFFVDKPDTGKVWLVVSISQYGNKYVKTEADGVNPNNLLSLSEC